MHNKNIQHWLSPYSQSLGLELVSVSVEEVVEKLLVLENMDNRNRVMHGGAIMGAADSIVGVAAAVNLYKDASTTALESKTNFIRSAQIGDEI